MYLSIYLCIYVSMYVCMYIHVRNSIIYIYMNIIECVICASITIYIYTYIHIYMCVCFTVIYLYHIICSIRTHFGVSVRKTLSGPQSPTLCSFLITGCNSRYEDFNFGARYLKSSGPAVHAWHCLAPLWRFVRAATFAVVAVAPCTTSSAVIRCQRIAAGEAVHS